MDNSGASTAFFMALFPPNASPRRGLGFGCLGLQRAVLSVTADCAKCSHDADRDQIVPVSKASGLVVMGGTLRASLCPACAADGDVTWTRAHRRTIAIELALGLNDSMQGDLFLRWVILLSSPRRHTSMPALSGVARFHRRDPSSSSQPRYFGQPGRLYIESHLPHAPSGAEQPILSLIKYPLAPVCWQPRRVSSIQVERDRMRGARRRRR